MCKGLKISKCSGRKTSCRGARDRRLDGLAHREDSKHACEIIVKSILMKLRSVNELYKITYILPGNILSYAKKPPKKPNPTHFGCYI